MTVPGVELLWGAVIGLYGIIVGILWKIGLFRGVPGDVDTNEDDIKGLQRDIAEVRRNVVLLKQDTEMLHDLIADSNHCGSEHCRFCDYDGEEETEDY